MASRDRHTSTSDRTVTHHRVEIDGISVFYREAGPKDAPVLLLPHGYPFSSYAYRAFMPAMADRWRLIAPDFPGFGYSDTPDPTRFAYTFDGYADVLRKFVTTLSFNRYTLYLHDYGSQIGLRLAIQVPEQVTALIIQNGDIYEGALGPKYQGLMEHFANPTPESRQQLVDAVSEHGFRDEFETNVRDDLRMRIAPDLWTLHWSLMNTPVRRAISVALMEGL